MTVWSHLSNANHINALTVLIDTHHDKWIVASTLSLHWHEQYPSFSRQYLREMAWDRCSELGRLDILDAVWGEITVKSVVGRLAIWGATLALVAHDNAGQFLSLNVNELKTWIVLSADPGAGLLLPMVMVQEMIIEERITK